MNQVEKVSIGGYAFTMESGASASISAYLSELETYYKSSEVMEGIEERMAELLLERTGRDGVVTPDDILSIIEILGRPEKIEEEEPAAERLDAGGAAQTTAPRIRKRLYRDLEKAKVAGVCSGFAAFTGIDVAIVRTIYLVLVLLPIVLFIVSHGVVGTGFLLAMLLVYVVLWIAMPAARTARQKWELRGEDGSAENIRRNVESGAGRVGDAINQVGKAPVWGGIGRILEVIIGLLLLIIAFSGLFGGALAILGWQWLGLSDVANEVITDISSEITNFQVIIQPVWVKALAIVVYALPFIWLLYSSILMLFRLRAPSWHPGLLIVVFWILAVVALIILLIISTVPLWNAG